jgi:hypothetical protein
VRELRTQAEYFVEVRLEAPLLESVLKAECKIVDKHGSIRVIQGEKLQCSPIDLNGFVEVRHDSMLQESLSKAGSKIVQRGGSI